MKIGMFSESYLPIKNGVAVSISTLSDELIRLGHEVYIVAPKYKGYKDAGDNVIRLSSFRTFVEPEYPIPYPIYPGISKKVKGLNLDIIHTHTCWQLGWLGLKLARSLRIPVVSTNHTKYAEYAHYFPLAPKTITKMFIIKLMYNYYNSCDSVITPSVQVLKLLQEYGINKSIYPISTGLAKNMYRSDHGRKEVRGMYDIPADSKLILYVGRLAKEKNLKLLFDSFELLASNHPNLRLMIVGNGPAEVHCQQAKNRSKYSSRIILTGAISRENIVNYYSAGDLFAFPSLTDTQGLVLCEALQAGLPCVGVNAGGTPEMITDTEDGYLTDNTVQDFSDKISKIIDDDALMKKLSESAVENSKRFTPAEMVEKVLAVYNSLLIDEKRST